MAKVAGVDVLLYVETATPGTFVVLGGQSGATLNRSTNVVDTTSKDANGWAENVAGVNSWAMDCDGFIVSGDAGYTRLESLWNSRSTIKAEIRMPSGTKYTGDCIIADLPMEFPQDGAATYSVSLTGTGALTQV
jgi:TP901-1 family phage major tail protein